MSKYRIIGNMTGNSMDALDFILTEFDEDKITDICAYSKPYDNIMQKDIEELRRIVFNKTYAEIEDLSFFHEIHDKYIKGIADAINEMCEINHINKSEIDAIGFHGKTLDHNPKSKANRNGDIPYTLQMGSGQMLSDLTGIKVIYDFRSELIVNGFEGAPLIPPHNAHIAQSEGNGIYYNGGNTSNFALINNNIAIIGSDAGPFNEYTDNFVRDNTNLPYDVDGCLGSQGKINISLMTELFNVGEVFYQSALPKSGDPSYYHKDDIFNYIKEHDISINDAIRTFEYFAAYIAVFTLDKIPSTIEFPNKIILFGGGWKNPLVLDDFKNLLNGQGEVLDKHKSSFNNIRQRFKTAPQIVYSAFGKYMEARLFADMAKYYLDNKTWELAEVVVSGKNIVLGKMAQPGAIQEKYFDKINFAAKGWQNR